MAAVEQAESTRSNRLLLYVAGTLLLVVASAWLYRALRRPEPVYQGKTAAQWFYEFQKASAQPLAPATSIPSSGQSFIRLGSGIIILPASSTPAIDPGAAERERALTGLRALGTNAAVYLGREFLREDGWLALGYWKLHSKAPPGIKRLLPEPAVPRNVVRGEIATVLGALGNNAAPALPAIITVLRSGEASRLAVGVNALHSFPFERQVLDPVLEDWDLRGQYTNIHRVVTDLYVLTPVAAKCLGHALSGGNAGFRRACEYELEHFGAAAITAVTALTAALADPDVEIRYGAARALERIGPGAAPAVPALIHAASDESIMVQRASARALRIIQDQATN
jgi:hypothetical protein